MTPLPAVARPKLVVAISGGGTTLRNLIDRIAGGTLDAEIVGVVATRDDIGGVAIANDAGLPIRVLRRDDFLPSPEADPDAGDAAYSDALFDFVREQAADLVVMAGFLAFVEIPPDFEHRVLNIHPSLIPAFCGKGYYGLRVHRAVIERGCRVSGCTVHLVDNEYDHGPIVDQRVVDVDPADTPESLAARVFETECELYPAAIAAVAAGTLSVDGRRVVRGS